MKTKIGAQFWDEVRGELQFPQQAMHDYIDNFYRTVYGPAVAHNAVTYCDCDHCTALAFRRMTAAREPESGPDDVYGTLGERELSENQVRFYAQEMPQHIKTLKRKYGSYLTPEAPHLEDMKRHISDPHPKRRLREDTMSELEREGLLERRLFCKSVLYKLKREEYAKPDKLGRMIGDLGVAASLQGYRLMEALKTAQSEEKYEFDGGYIRFVKTPDPDVLEEVFRDLIDPPGEFVYVYFSDDACYSERTPQGIRMTNIDISSCDTSQGPSVFQALIDLMPEDQKSVMQVLVDQCKLPVRLVSRSNRRNVCLLKPLNPRLYSGSTITTAINNMANLSIAIAIRRNRNMSEVQAARQAGFIITSEPCLKPEHLQFLKTSPVQDVDGNWKPVLNLGVLLRFSGSCKGDLPGRGDLQLRAKVFQGALLNGYMAKASIPMLNAFRRRYPLSAKEQKKSNITAKTLERLIGDMFDFKFDGGGKFTDVAVLARYELSDLEKLEVYQLFNDCKFGQIVGNGGLSRILEKDYKMCCNHFLTSPISVDPDE
jgi:hypothetical protein